ncbi:class I SAM-dependent methyltransferase [Exilibacterium tricleocarpae]|uniref:Class I SAM-dependent methyltransferase n=1 Tax=Exilibacterium tricleocarpae TaxID=2591008 RepID=A0A545TLH4_9GAMM|nr:methyltransferase [Exilibacterium tricleocarpae]TQV78070.1 class I SAM-dependent methyltransferase [Exilibacterium tricleocarpae]
MDPCYSALLPYLTAPDRPTLWFADENASTAGARLQRGRHPYLTAFSNRYDVYQHLCDRGVRSHFCDFDCALLDTVKCNILVYRISKEKPLTHHLINRAYTCLEDGGTLVLCGEKSEGIKSYAKKASVLFGSNATLKKAGRAYITTITKTPAAGPRLDDQHYAELRPIAQVGGTPIYSKPGVFGWNKIDAGSALLIENLAPLLALLPAPPATLLDLGCGYGYLTLASTAITAQRRVATDNNAAALKAAEYNFSNARLAVSVVADDCGAQLRERFDLIVCNPPFHRGFGVEGDLTDKFLQRAAQLLSAQGAAFFVVNQFLPLQRKAAALFTTVNKVAGNGSFNVFYLAGSR